MSDALHERGKALEDIFFAGRNLERVQALRDAAAHDRAVHELEDVTGISDHELLDHLVDVGLTADTLAAFSLVPVLHVAWADRVLDGEERKVILLEAHEAGVAKGTVAHTVLENWLSAAPNHELWAVWKEYWAALHPQLPAEAAANLKARLLTIAGRVARASGGMLGFNRVSAPEAGALAELERLLS